MRLALFLIALSISDVAKSDLSEIHSVVAVMFFGFLAMDIYELFDKN